MLVFDLFIYDVSRDSQRFLINAPFKQAFQPMSITLNWHAGDAQPVYLYQQAAHGGVPTTL